MNHLELACNLINPKYNHILEFGVYKGASIYRIKNYVKPNIKIFGFDSFNGLPEDWVQYDGGIAGDGLCVKGFFTTNGNLPNISGVTFYKGMFEETIKEYKKIGEPIALIHIDCDLYSSTKSVLYGLIDFIKEDTILVFDEWYYNGDHKYNDHEQKCFYEFVNDFNINYELIETDINSEQQIIKIIKI